MKRKITILALTIILALSVFALSSCFLIPDEIQFELNEDGSSYYVSSIRSGVEIADIPSEYEGKSVTAIGEKAAADCTSLTQVIIPEGVTKIGSSAFSGCNALEQVSLPSTLNTVDYDAFKDCTGLKKIEISDIESFFKISFDDSFSGEGNPTVYGDLYINGEPLTELVFAKDMERIENKIKRSRYITKIVFSQESLFEIADYAFSDFTALESISLPQHAKIGNLAFAGCTSLKTVVFEDETKELLSYEIFSGCSSLERVVIPSSLKKLSRTTFATSYSYPGTAIFNIYISDLAGWCNITLTDTYKLPVEYNLYLNEQPLTKLVIPNNVTKISDIFSSCSSIEELYIGDNVKEIEHDAFKICRNLKKVEIHGIENLSIKDLGDNCFENCFSLESVVIGDGIKRIPVSAFSGCDNLKSITFTDTDSWTYSHYSSSLKFDATVTDPEKNVELFKSERISCLYKK